MFVTAIAVIAIPLLVYYYVKRKYFTLHGPLPGLQPEFYYGNLRQTGILTQSESLVTVHLDLQRRFGDVYQFWMGIDRFIVVCNAEDVQHIFTHRHVYDLCQLTIDKFSLLFPNSMSCSTGAQHKRHASCIVPLLRHSRICGHSRLITDCVDQLLLDPWRVLEKDAVQQDIFQQCERLLLVIFGHIGFNYDLELSNNDDLRRALRIYLDFFKTILFMPHTMGKIYLQLNRDYRRAKATIERYLIRIMEQEQTRNDESTRTSVLASLVSSPHELSHDEIIHEMLLLLAAGYESTATALTWFVHLMSKHPEVQRKIKSELAECSFSADRLDSLIYLDAVVREVLRFASPSFGIFRSLTTDDRLPASGVHLHRGEQVMIPVYNLHWDPRYWTLDPKRFCPERFLNQSAHSGVMLSFGGGHRQCVGQELAQFELKTIAARLMQHVTFGHGGLETNNSEHDHKFTIIPKHVSVTVSFD